jgi:hypothetical protein
MTRPAIVFPDVELWAVGYLKAQLDARPETYAADVEVNTKTPNPRPPKLVTVRRDGGPLLDLVRETARLGVNVWAPHEADANDLTRLVRALLGAAAGHGPVLRVSGLFGSSAIPEASGNHRRFFTVELVVRGSTL